MKKYLAFLLLVPLLVSFGGDPGSDQSRKRPLSWNVAYEKPDSSVRKSDAKVFFTFETEENTYIPVRDSVILSYNGIQKTVHCDSLGHASLLLSPGKYKFQFWHDDMTFEIYTDTIAVKGGNITGIAVYFLAADYQMEADKPVIYFYPESTQTVNVKLDVHGALEFSYPQYNPANGWIFTADTDGTLHSHGKSFDYLFWDGRIPISAEQPVQQEGFIVQRDSLVSFLESNLTQMNLDAREQEDFITYWCPRMLLYEETFIHFRFNEDYNSIAGISINPQPDHLFRVFMEWQDASGMDAKIIHSQTIPRVQREGFTVIEWGGAEVSALSQLQQW